MEREPTHTLRMMHSMSERERGREGERKREREKERKRERERGGDRYDIQKRATQSTSASEVQAKRGTGEKERNAYTR